MMLFVKIGYMLKIMCVTWLALKKKSSLHCKLMCLSCVYYVCIMCVSCVYHVSINVYHVSIMCLSCVYHVSIMCQSMCIMCLSCVYHVCIMCLSCVYHVLRKKATYKSLSPLHLSRKVISNSQEKKSGKWITSHRLLTGKCNFFVQTNNMQLCCIRMYMLYFSNIVAHCIRLTKSRSN
jgi:hypothetical protein